MKKVKRTILAVLMLVAVTSHVDATDKDRGKTKSFDVKKGGALIVDIENIGADILVKTWSKSEVNVRVEGISSGDMEWLEMDQTDNTVNVVFDAQNGWKRHRSARFYISVPSEFDLDLGTSGGDVEVTGAVKGTVSARTAGGDVQVGDVDGQVVLKTAGGDVTAGNIDGDAKLKTAGGDVTVGDVMGELDAVTAGGDIETGRVEKNLNATTSGGDITCEDVGGEVEAKTSGGDINIGVVGGEVSARTAGGDIELSGATGEVIAKTAGGDVELSAVKGSVDVSTAGGDITVELNPTNVSKSDMETAGGDVILILPADAEATVEALIRLRDRGRGWDDEIDDYDIRSDFKAESKDKTKREIQARFVINGGGKIIRIKTTNGNIDIQKR